MRDLQAVYYSVICFRMSMHQHSSNSANLLRWKLCQSFADMYPTKLSVFVLQMTLDVTSLFLKLTSIFLIGRLSLYERLAYVTSSSQNGLTYARAANLLIDNREAMGVETERWINRMTGRRSAWVDARVIRRQIFGQSAWAQCQLTRKQCEVVARLTAPTNCCEKVRPNCLPAQVIVFRTSAKWQLSCLNRPSRFSRNLRKKNSERSHFSN